MRIAPSCRYVVVNGTAHTDLTAHSLNNLLAFANRRSFAKSGITAASWRSRTQDRIGSSLGIRRVPRSVDESCPSGTYQILSSPPSFLNNRLMWLKDRYN